MSRNPTWFEPNGRNLSFKGKRHLYQLLREGRRHATIAAELEIDQSAVSHWAKKWGFPTARQQRTEETQRITEQQGTSQ